MCVDFIDLNNACLKDSSLLPRIDQLVDSIVDISFLLLWTPSLGITRYK